MNALQKAKEDKENGTVGKSLGLIVLTKEAQQFIKNEGLTIITKIPGNSMKYYPPIGNKTAKKMSLLHEESALVMSIADSAKSSQTGSIVSLRCLRAWKKKFCPKAQIYTQIHDGSFR